MHLIRLLLQGIGVLQNGQVSVHVADHRRSLLEIRDGITPWHEVNQWRLELHREFEAAYATTSLPVAPDYAAANRLLLWARRSMVDTQTC